MAVFGSALVAALDAAEAAVGATPMAAAGPAVGPGPGLITLRGPARS